MWGPRIGGLGNRFQKTRRERLRGRKECAVIYGRGEKVLSRIRRQQNIPGPLPIYFPFEALLLALRAVKKVFIGPALLWVFSNLKPPKFYLARVHLHPEAVTVWRVH